MTARISEIFSSFIKAAMNLASAAQADAIVLLIDHATDWEKLKKQCGKKTLIVSGTNSDLLQHAQELGIQTITLEMADSAPVHERLSQSVLDSVANEFIRPGATVVAVYRGFEQDHIDSISVFKLNERLGRLTARDLRRLDTKVPLETLKVVVDLAVEIGREGREGKPVGTMFVVGDHRRVLKQSQQPGFDTVKGYKREERNLSEPRVRESVKNIAQLDGAFVIAADGTIEASCRIIDTNPVELTMTSGLGSRHYSGAAISKNTDAIAVVVSESNGTVRIFQNGQIVLRIEPLGRRAMKWKGPTSELSPTVDVKSAMEAAAQQSVIKPPESAGGEV